MKNACQVFVHEYTEERLVACYKLRSPDVIKTDVQ